ncbi:MAG TPA: glycine betaine ABC transporter substrate-binding protein [Euzebyales bacterium]|nr:glycine betaine ABC transporter substrate-binding protein [Euzebyales bacterium]
MAHIPRLAALGLLIAVLAGGCRTADAVPALVIGVGSTNEQRVLAALAAEALGRADIAVEVRSDLGGTLGLRRQALGDQIDLFWDYTGAAWALGLREAAPPADPVESWERVREADERQGLRWLAPTRANATLALAVRATDLPPPDAQRDLGWLAGQLSGGQRRLCADADFMARDGGLRALAAEYGIDVAGLPRRPADENEAVEAVRDGECYAGLVTATSGEAMAAGLVPVEDELRVFPAFVVAPVVREGSPADATAVIDALAPVTAALDTPTLAGLNARGVDGEDPADIASSFVDVLDEPTPTPAQ